MNFERRGPEAFNQDNFPLPGNDLASAHVGSEKVVLIEDDLKRVKKEEIPLYDEDKVGALDVVRRKEEPHHVGWGSLDAEDVRRKRNNNAKNAKREERPKGSADLPFDVN